MPSVVKVDTAAIKAFLNDPNGPVARDVMVRATAVQQKAKASLKSGFPSDFLGPSIVKRLQMVDGAPHVFVGSSKVKTKPHIISGNPMLAFKWPRMGSGMFFFRTVHHPGSDFNQYLTEKLVAALPAARGV